MADYTKYEKKLIEKYGEGVFHHLVIGFTNEYWTLWQWTPYQTYDGQSYTYLQNLKLEGNDIFEMYPNIDVDEGLRGESYRRPIGYFPYGKYQFCYPSRIEINDDVLQYFAWWVNKDGLEDNVLERESYLKFKTKNARLKEKDLLYNLVEILESNGYKYYNHEMVTDQIIAEREERARQRRERIDKIVGSKPKTLYFKGYNMSLVACEGGSYNAVRDAYFEREGWMLTGFRGVSEYKLPYGMSARYCTEDALYLDEKLVDSKGKNKIFKNRLIKIDSYLVEDNEIKVLKWSIVPKCKFVWDTKSWQGLPDGVTEDNII